jgi:hypothetical protein
LEVHNKSDFRSIIYMKKLLFFLLTILTMHLQAQVGITSVKDTSYYPRISDAGVSWRQQGYAVIKPNNYDPSKTYPVWMLIHGMGELSEGKLANLRNVVLGFGYGPGGSRVYAVATDDFKAAVNQYQFLGVIVTYANEFNPTDINFVLDDVEKYWSVDKSREAIIGFSLGGGAVVRYITSSLVNAQRIAFAVACAPVNWATTLKNVVDANLPFIGATNRTDPRVDPSNVKNIVSGINALNPAYPAKLIVFPEDGHGSINQMLSLSDPTVPQPIYPYLNSITKDSPKQYPTSNTTSPVPPVVIPPSTTLSASFNVQDGATVTSSSLNLDASASSGVSPSYDGYIWGVQPITGAWSLVVQGGAYGGPLKTITGLKNGSYSIVLTVKDKAGNTAQKGITINVALDGATVVKVPASYDGVNLVFTDGSKEPATLFWNGTKVTATTAAGVIYPIQ